MLGRFVPNVLRYIKMSTFSDNGNKAVNRIWRLVTASVDIFDGWYKKLGNGMSEIEFPYQMMESGIGYVPIQVVAEIRDKNKPSKRAYEGMSKYDKLSEEDKRRADVFLRDTLSEDKKRRVDEILHS